jgi:hypothetical protein
MHPAAAGGVSQVRLTIKIAGRKLAHFWDTVWFWIFYRAIKWDRP